MRKRFGQHDMQGYCSKESLDKRGLDSGSEQEAWFLPLIAPDAIF
jgi:hypothetical protein